MTTVLTEKLVRRFPAHGTLAFGCVAILCLGVSGCKSPFGMFGNSLADDEKTKQMSSIEDTRGPLERLLKGKKDNEEARALTTAEGLADLDKARQVLDSGETAKGEKALKKVAKKHKDSPVAEDALFLVAESQFKRKRYAAAQDTYDDLLEKFPSTQYLDKATQRLFTIAQIWLQSPTVAKTEELTQVNFEDPSKTKPPVDPNPPPRGITRRVPILPNFTDKTRPMFDTEGRALEALRNIWKKDPTGPLTDDALMLEASYHLRNGNYIEADHLFSILREEFPKSPHFEDAFVFGSHVKLMSYQGSEYDPQALESAQQLKESAVRLFPENPARDRLQDELIKIQSAKVEQIWQDAMYWKRKGKPKAVAIYCQRIVEEYPNSEYAIRARKLLEQVEGAADKPASIKLAPVPGENNPAYDESGTQHLGPDPAHQADELSDDGPAGRSSL